MKILETHIMVRIKNDLPQLVKIHKTEKEDSDKYCYFVETNNGIIDIITEKEYQEIEEITKKYF